MLRKFFKEERAQGAIEYILLAGGIIVAAVVIYAIYSQITKSAAGQLGTATNRAAEESARIINNAVNNMI